MAEIENQDSVVWGDERMDLESAVYKESRDIKEMLDYLCLLYTSSCRLFMPWRMAGDRLQEEWS